MGIMNTMTGNRAIFKIAGQVIGVAQNVTFNDDAGLQDVDGIGNHETQELVTGKVSYNISGDKYFVSGKMLNKLGLVPTSDEWLTSPELEVEIIDKVSGETIELYTGCKFATHSRTYGKHTISSESFTIRALHKGK